MPRFDQLHPAARSAIVLGLLVPLMAAATALAGAVMAAGGASGVDWGATLTAALDAAAVAAAGGVGTFGALYVTPLTREFGIGSAKEH